MQNHIIISVARGWKNVIYFQASLDLCSSATKTEAEEEKKKQHQQANECDILSGNKRVHVSTCIENDLARRLQHECQNDTNDQMDAKV